MSTADLRHLRTNQAKVATKLQRLQSGVDHTQSDPLKDVSCAPWDLPSDPIFPTLAELEAEICAERGEFAFSDIHAEYKRLAAKRAA